MSSSPPPTTATIPHGEGRTKIASRIPPSRSILPPGYLRGGGWRRYRAGRLVVHELEVDHLGGVTVARPELDDARVAARSVGKARRNVGEELMHHVLGAQLGEREPPRVKVAALAERDHLLRERLDRLGL